jgi:hypothetical protein
VLDKHNIKDHHMGLLRVMYLEFGDQDEGIMMGYKRPFGNSHVLDDVRDEIEKYNSFYTCEWRNAITQEGDDNYELEQKVLEEFINFLEDFYKDFELPYNSFVYTERRYRLNMKSTTIIREFLEDIEKRWGHVIKHRAHSYLHDWSIDPVLIRDEKIEKLLQ